MPGLECEYCGSVFQKTVDRGFRVPKPEEELRPQGVFELRVGEARYTVLGQLATGENSQVLLARRARAVTEQVVIKIGSQELEREWATLRHLYGRRNYLDRLLPQPLHLSPVRGGKTALVYRWRSGFVYTLAFARSQYPKGVPATAVVWMWNRILDQLTCLGELGYCHGDLRLEHLLVHTRDHGIAFAGWGQARLGGHDDLGDSGRCVAELLGKKAPTSLRALTQEASLYDHPQQLKTELARVAEAAFGPPRYQSFALPRA